jgi:hypothetical protein
MTTMYIYHATTATFPYSFPKWYFKRFLYCASTQLTCVVVLIVVVRDLHLAECYSLGSINRNLLITLDHFDTSIVTSKDFLGSKFNWNLLIKIINRL